MPSRFKVPERPTASIAQVSACTTHVWLAHQLAHEGLFRLFGGVAAIRMIRQIWLASALNNRKRPSGEEGRYLGLLQGGEICISIYVDPWEVGGPSCAAGVSSLGNDERHVGGAEPSQEDLCSSGHRRSPSYPLIRVRTYVRFVCEWDHRGPGQTSKRVGPVRSVGPVRRLLQPALTGG